MGRCTDKERVTDGGARPGATSPGRRGAHQPTGTAPWSPQGTELVMSAGVTRPLYRRVVNGPDKGTVPLARFQACRKTRVLHNGNLCPRAISSSGDRCSSTRRAGETVAQGRGGRQSTHQPPKAVGTQGRSPPGAQLSAMSRRAQDSGVRRFLRTRMCVPARNLCESGLNPGASRGTLVGYA